MRQHPRSGTPSSSDSTTLRFLATGRFTSVREILSLRLRFECDYTKDVPPFAGEVDLVAKKT